MPPSVGSGEPLDLFSRIPTSVRGELRAAGREIAYPVGTVVVEEGSPAESVFFCLEGTAEATAESPGGPLPLLTIDPGEVFGVAGVMEEATLYEATVTARTPLRVLCVPAGQVRAAMRSSPTLDAELRRIAEDALEAKFLKCSTVFTTLDEAQLQTLAARVTPHRAEAGEFVLRQGEKGDFCYLIRSGKVEVLVESAGAAPRRLATLSRGMLFGEAALLTDAPRNASVRALEACELLVLGREDLTAALNETRAGARVLELFQIRGRPRQATGIQIQPGSPDEGAFAVLKNPRTGTFYRLSREGYFLWQRMDGHHTMRDLAFEFQDEFKTLSPATIGKVVAGLARAGFIELPNLRDEVMESVLRVTPLQRALMVLHRILTWTRIYENVDALLSRLYRRGVFIVYRGEVQVLLALVAGGGLIAFAAGGARALQAAGASGQVGLLLLALLPLYLISIVLHEAGHAFTVKRFGRKVRGAGIGWYILSPILFVDTSEMWLAERWPRMAVTLAGPYTNLVLGGAAALGAVLAPDPLLLPLWLFAGASYLLVLLNLNPLLSYDGYYLLSDLLRRPNLRRESLTWLRSHWFGALLNPGRLRGHGAHVLFGLWSIAYVVILTAVTIAVFDTFAREWLAERSSPRLAEAGAWMSGGVVVLLALLGAVSESRVKA